MKQTILLLLLTITFPMTMTGQEKIGLDLENRPVSEALQEIERQSDYTFSYSPSLLKEFPRVTVYIVNEPLEEVLQLLFGKTNIQYVMQGKYIILKKRPKEITVSGFIYDRESHESLIAANVYDLASGQGAVSNNFGFYSLSVPPGKIALRPSYVGYASEIHPFTVTQDTVIHFFLQPSSLLKEVVVDGELKNPVQHAETGKISLNAATLTALPTFLGESDVIKTLQLMPGVAVGTDGMAGLYVRGGNADENLYLVDGNPLYHVHHLLGLFSTFNPEAVKTMDFYKGSFPARYGGRLSSVVDVRMNDGDMKKSSGTASIGLISSQLNLQGPIIKDKTSFSISIRRTYLDMIARPTMYFINRNVQKKNPDRYDKVDLGYYFYDFNAKINHKFSDKSRIYLSVYDGKDKLFFKSESVTTNIYRLQHQGESGTSETGGTPGTGDTPSEYTYNMPDRSTGESGIDIGWGTRMASLSWAYAINSKLFSNATLVHNRFKSDISLYTSSEDFTITKNPETGQEETVRSYQFFKPIYKSGIEDIGYRLDFDYAYNNNHLIRFGTTLLHHNFRPEESRIFRKDEERERIKNDTITYANDRTIVKEISLYAEDEMDLSKRWKVNTGLHLSGFFVQGKSYLSAQPRLSARYLLSKDLSLKASYGRMSQYVHLLQSSYLNAPNDLWVPITKNVKPMSSHQFTAGIFGRYRGFDLSAEAYYKKSTNQVEYKDGANILAGNNNWEDRIAQGNGTSYGVELMAKKSFGKTSGWVGYTLSWANRHFPDGEINQGKVYPAKYDNRHKINAVIMHKFNRKFDLNLSWIYATGNWTTLPEEDYIDMNGKKVHYIYQRNNYKMSDYQRLDLSFNYYRHKKNGRMGIWNFSIYNVYAHHNSFLILPSEGYTRVPQGPGIYICRKAIPHTKVTACSLLSLHFPTLINSDEMMKSNNRYLPFLLIVILTIFSACQKEIILDHRGYIPKIVMNGIISPDSLIEIKVSKSLLYTDTFPDNTLLKDATLTLFINGQQREKMVLSRIDTIREYSNGRFSYITLLSVFRSTIRPKIGARIRIEASAEGYNTAWAETTIPVPPQINRIDTSTFLTTKNIINTGYSNFPKVDYSRIYPKNTSVEEQFRNLRLKMAITTGSGASQYFLLRVRPMTEKIDVPYNTWARFFYIYTDDDPVFDESYQNNIIEDVIMDGTDIEGRKYFSSLLFSDKLFRNNQYTLDFSLTGYYYIHTEYEQKENENGAGWDVYPISTEVFNPPLEVQFTLITPELYPYYRKINDNPNRDENPLLVVSEPEITFSNVHNGIGIVGAESSAKAQIEIPPFPGGENRVPRSF